MTQLDDDREDFELTDAIDDLISDLIDPDDEPESDEDEECY